MKTKAPVKKATVNVYQTTEFQKLYMSVRNHVKGKFTNIPMHRVVPKLMNAIAMLRYDNIKDREMLAAKTGIIEREIDKLYVQDPTSEEVHYADYVFTKCCMELTKLHFHQKFNVFEAI